MTGPPWVATHATVRECKYQFARLNTLTFGLQTGKKFLITFDYYANGRLYSGDFQSPTSILQDQRIPITYNPQHPEQNSLSRSQTLTQSPLFAIGIAGSILLSLTWFALLRGCR